MADSSSSCKSNNLLAVQAIVFLGVLVGLQLHGSLTQVTTSMHRANHSQNSNNEWLDSVLSSFSSATNQKANQTIRGSNDTNSMLTASCGQTTNGNKTKLLIYMTTHLSDEHLAFLPCWEDALQEIEFLRSAHLLLMTPDTASPEKVELFAQRLSTTPSSPGFAQVNVQTFVELSKLRAFPAQQAMRMRKQHGAVRAMIEPWQHGWFDDYEWVMRLNPDVLLRRHAAAWLETIIADPTIGAAALNCNADGSNKNWGPILNTDFSLFRPAAMNPTFFISKNSPKHHAERHFTWAVLRSGLLPPAQWNALLRQQEQEKSSIDQPYRIVYIPGANKYKSMCRIVGRTSPVVHDHELRHACPNYWNVTDGEWY